MCGVYVPYKAAVVTQSLNWSIYSRLYGVATTNPGATWLLRSHFGKFMHYGHRIESSFKTGREVFQVVKCQGNPDYVWLEVLNVMKTMVR